MIFWSDEWKVDDEVLAEAAKIRDLQIWLEKESKFNEAVGIVLEVQRLFLVAIPV